MSDDARSSRPLWLGQDRRTWDHVRIHVQVLQDPKLGAYEIAVYAGIAVHAEIDTGNARPSLSTLGKYAQCSVPTVRRALKNLVKHRYLDVIERSGKASWFRLLPPPTGKPVEGVTEPDLQTSGQAPANDRTGTLPSGLHEQEPGTRSNDDSFEEFWNVYPKRNGRRLEKPKAREQWKRLKPQQRANAMIGVRAYASACDRNEQLAKDAFRWLRDRSFEEWVELVNPRKPPRTSAPPPMCIHGMLLKAHCPDCEEEGIAQKDRRAV